MAQQQIGALAAIALYTVDSDFESEDEADKVANKGGDLVIKEEKIDVDEIKDDKENFDDSNINLMDNRTVNIELKDSTETKHTQNDERVDFSDICIKEEPIWVEDKEGLIDPVDQFKELQEIKVEIESDSDDDSSSSSDSDSSDDVGDARPVVNDEDKDKEDTGPPRTRNEITHKDLPPVEDLEIRVPLTDCLKVGVVTSTVDELVVVESIPDMPALDLESVLFTKLEDGGLTLDLKAIGRVFDVIGPVTRPFYVIRFNSQDHIESKGVKTGQEIFFAPKSEHTSFVFLEQLMNMKISDASWMNDEEPPPQFLEYSDDEQETKAKQERTIARMVKKGVDPSEVEAKKARMERGNVRNKDHCNRTDSVDKRHNNGLYSDNVNPFYRQERRYDPRNSGPIKWTDYNAQSNSRNTSNMNQNSYPSPTNYPTQNNPTPNYSTTTNYYQPPSYSVPPPGWPSVTTPTAVQSAGWQSQYNHQAESQYNYQLSQPPPASQRMPGLWQPPPPPPPQ